ncbi:unnamed protein product [Chrysoparadoxa australica]
MQFTLACPFLLTLLLCFWLPRYSESFAQLGSPNCVQPQPSFRLLRGGAREKKTMFRDNEGLRAPFGAEEATLLLPLRDKTVNEVSDTAAPHKFLGVTFMLAASFSISTMLFLVKILPPDFSPVVMVFWRSIIQLAISFIAVSASSKEKSRPIFGPRRIWKALFFRALFGSGAVASFFIATQALPLSDSITLQFTIPAFTAALAALVLGEKWGKLDITGAVVCLAGVVLIAQPSFLFPAAVAANTAPWAVGVGVGGAAMAGIAYVIVRAMGDSADSSVQVLWYAMVSTLMCLPAYALVGGDWAAAAAPGWANFSILVGMGICGYAGQWFTNRGLQLETAAKATLVTNTQIVFAFLYQIILLHEPAHALSLAGTGLIVGFMCIAGYAKVHEA